MTEPESLRARAAECLENARHARDHEIAARWQEMAALWTGMAEQQVMAERRWHGLAPGHWAAISSAQRVSDRVADAVRSPVDSVAA
jgi:hypothetical protein